MESGKSADSQREPTAQNLNSPDMLLILKGHQIIQYNTIHQHVRVDTRFVKLVVVPSRHRVPKLSLLFPSLPPPRELPDQTRHTSDVVSLQAFRNSRLSTILFFSLASTPTGALTSLSCTNCKVSRSRLLFQPQMVVTSSHTYVFCTLVHIPLQLRVPCQCDASSSFDASQDRPQSRQ